MIEGPEMVADGRSEGFVAWRLFMYFGLQVSTGTALLPAISVVPVQVLEKTFRQGSWHSTRQLQFLPPSAPISCDNGCS